MALVIDRKRQQIDPNPEQCGRQLKHGMTKSMKKGGGNRSAVDLGPYYALDEAEGGAGDDNSFKVAVREKPQRIEKIRKGVED